VTLKIEILVFLLQFNSELSSWITASNIDTEQRVSRQC